MFIDKYLPTYGKVIFPTSSLQNISRQVDQSTRRHMNVRKTLCDICHFVLTVLIDVILYLLYSRTQEPDPAIKGVRD
jgi:hypothetical protein